MTGRDAKTIDLDGAWLIRADVGDVGLTELWWKKPLNGHDWRAIQLPCAWQTILGHEFHGVAWLRRSVRIDAAWCGAADRVWLCFDSVATDCRAWVNGMDVGRHIGDWLPFQFDICEALRRGPGDEAEIVLRIDEIPAPPPATVGDLQNGHITKGFHDVLSIQQGGAWQSVWLKLTGELAIRPDGFWLETDAITGRVSATVELQEPASSRGEIELRILESDHFRGSVSAAIEVGQHEAVMEWTVADHTRWSPADPHLYTAEAIVRDQSGVSDRLADRFGFRSVRTGGPRNTQILLNDSPIMLRGVLHWGHEPHAIAPAPTPEQASDEFARLKATGFNAVCLCMWYPPRWYFDLADEMGMLIWQEHPVWQSPMRDEDVPEYQRLFQGFFRRDRNHPSVVIVSATCEHPSFHPQLAAWWWSEARRQLPSHLLQVQTAFFKWADHQRTDLHDEHTYDNSNRWVAYLEDVEHELAKLPSKPFAMGETITFSSWPDVAGLDAAGHTQSPWWHPRAIEHMRELESGWRERYGEAVVARFKRHSERHHFLGRKFQVEQFRNYPNHAAIVMNHLRDVPQCQCGFRDDLGRWRFDPEECRGWLGDVALLLRTPDQRRGFVVPADGGMLECEMAIANFGERDLDAPLTITASGFALRSHPTSLSHAVRARRGEIVRIPCAIAVPSEVHRPERMLIEAEIAGVVRNTWDLHLFPKRDMRWDPPLAVMRLDGLPFAPQDAEPDEVERGYSRGYGLAVRDWTCELPDPAKLLPHVAPWRFDHSIPARTRVIVTHKLTHALLDFMQRGGRVILLASKTAGGLGTSYEWLFGACPLIIEEGPIESGDSEWLIDLLDYDLVRRYARVIPVEALGIADRVDPLIRPCYTHDQAAGKVKFFDQLFMTNVGKGLLIVSSLDHSEDAGQYLLALMIDFALRDDSDALRALDPALLAKFAIA